MPFFGHSPISFRDRPLLFIDLEMSGLDVTQHEILEVAALVVSQPDFAIINSYYTKVRPVHIETADPAALEVIHYSPATWSDAVPVSQIITDLSALAPDCMLAGWCVQNEWDFLLSACQQEHLPYFFYNYILEVSSLAFVKLYPDLLLTRLGLASVCRHLHIPLDQHKPDSDIRATYEIFKLLIADGLPPTPHGPSTGE